MSATFGVRSVGWLWVLAVLFASSASQAWANNDKAQLDKLLTTIDQLWFGAKSTASVTMTVKTKHYTRNLLMTYWVKGRNNTLIRIDSPKKEKGTTTLKLGDDIYNYLPKIDRTIKVSAALRSFSWMGSHFTNDDLVNVTRFREDFTSEVLKKSKIKNKTIWKIELIPLETVALPWAKIMFIVNKSDTLPISQEFYDEKGKLVRTITYQKYKELGGRIVPSIVQVTPAGKDGEYTELIYKNIDRNVKFTPDFFSLSQFDAH